MRSTEHFVVHLAGPGGAGKTTIGAALADRLGVPFVDLDAEFAADHGAISAYLDAHGYDGYARRHAGLYLDLAATMEVGVVALSSGFMTYVHPDYL
jgi:shikimate kinase